MADLPYATLTPRHLVAVVTVVAVSILVTAGCFSNVTVSRSGRQADGWLAGQRLYVDPAGSAARQVTEWQRAGRVKDANLTKLIADQPTAIWLTGREDIGSLVSNVSQQATLVQSVPMFVLYNLPQRDCGGYSAGGSVSAAAYQTWIAKVAAGLGNRAAVVILEPDAIAHLIAGCIKGAKAVERLDLMAKAVRTLKVHAGTHVYLDAGNNAWIGDPLAEVRPLQAAGIMSADGFALNVANFQTTTTSSAYGKRISDALGGKHFVIDTGRNGNGPLPGTGSGLTWCNPPGRALGQVPTTATGSSYVDAYLWIKEPGVSDGACRPGEPPAGQWWPEYALQLAAGQGRP